MILKFHGPSTYDRWRTFSIDQKILNIASEFSRAKNGLKRGCLEDVRLAIERALELMDLTLEMECHQQSAQFWREYLRLREMLAECYVDPEINEKDFLDLFRGFLDLNPKVSNLKLEISA